MREEEKIKKMITIQNLDEKSPAKKPKKKKKKTKRLESEKDTMSNQDTLMIFENSADAPVRSISQELKQLPDVDITKSDRPHDSKDHIFYSGFDVFQDPNKTTKEKVSKLDITGEATPPEETSHRSGDD